MITSRAELGGLMKTLNLPMTVAELGVAGGSNALDMLRGGVEAIYLVDLWKHVDGMVGELGDPKYNHDTAFESCMNKLELYKDRITVLRGWAHEMASHVPDESLGMVYEDATHEEEWVLRNLNAWYPKVVPGGLVAGHDYPNRPGVKRAVDWFADQIGAEIHLLPEVHITYAGFYLIKPI